VTEAPDFLSQDEFRVSRYLMAFCACACMALATCFLVEAPKEDECTPRLPLKVSSVTMSSGSRQIDFTVMFSESWWGREDWTVQGRSDEGEPEILLRSHSGPLHIERTDATTLTITCRIGRDARLLTDHFDGNTIRVEWR
jgi:hypothetical protein